jgi:hypothetical protein
MNRNSHQIQINIPNQIDVDQFIVSNLTFTKLISDIENYRNAVLNKIDLLKKNKIPQLTIASVLYLDDISLVYTNDETVRPEFKALFKNARADNIPMLIKTNDEWLIYSSDQKGQWQLIKIMDAKMIQKLNKHKLPFEKNIAIPVFDTSVDASFLKEVLKNNHVYRSKYIEINNKYKYHEYVILIERLNVLQKRIQRFQYFEKNWLHGKNILGNSQDEVIKNTIKSIKEEADFAKTIVEETVDELYTLSFDVIEGNNKILFDNIIHCLDRVTKAADRISATMQTWDTVIGSSSIFKLARLVGARFVPLTREMDPWSPEESANDWNGLGHQKVLQWKNDILRTGKYLVQPTNAHVLIKNEGKHLTNETYLTGLICGSLPAIRTAISQLLSQLDAHKLYRLTVHNGHARCSGNALGLRRFANGEIEFFDPHNGLFIFPEDESFRIWFSQYLAEDLLNKPDINLYLFDLGKQPSFGVPTVPIIATFNPNKANISFDTTLIREKILLRINEEIINLKSSCTNLSDKTINALEILKTRINETESQTTLAGIVQVWLSETDGTGTKTYREIINGQSILGESSTTRLINLITSNYEINPVRLVLLQETIIKNTISLMTIKTFPVSLLFEKIKKICTDVNTSSNEMIATIKSKVSKLKYTGRLFTAEDNTDQDIKSFCTLINNLDAYNPHSLIKTAIALEELTHAISINNNSRQQKNISMPEKTKMILL